MRRGRPVAVAAAGPGPGFLAHLGSLAGDGLAGDGLAGLLADLPPRDVVASRRSRDVETVGRSRLLTIGTVSPNLAMKVVDDRALPGKEPVVESVLARNPSNGPQTVAPADLRHVPLEQLPGDEDVRQIVGSVIRTAEDQSRIQVARFNSAI